MKNYKLALIGYGNVGSGLTQILKDHGPRIAKQFGASFTINAISDPVKGSIYSPEGFNPGDLMAAIQSDGSLNTIDTAEKGWDSIKTIEETDNEIVVEMSFTDLNTGEPALSHIKSAIDRGKHISTTNKGPIALNLAEIQDLAEKKGVQIGFEGTVMSGSPALVLGTDILDIAGVNSIRGILNGTTNYMLTRMEQGASYENALADAQEMGYAEADPTGDVEGYDTAGKVLILARLIMGAHLRMKDIRRQGISHITQSHINAAKANGEKWKLIGSVINDNGKITAAVSPQRLPLEDPLASVSDAANAITYSTELLGDVTLIGPGAGRLETGFAVLYDLIGIHKKLINQ